ncbi:hypothetical protein ATERTT37_000639 [Aspergillus terreus]
MNKPDEGAFEEVPLESMVEYSNRKCQAGLIEQFFGVLLLISALRRFKIVALYREINQLLAMDLHLIQRGEPGGIQLMAERNLADPRPTEEGINLDLVEFIDPALLNRVVGLIDQSLDASDELLQQRFCDRIRTAA